MILGSSFLTFAGDAFSFFFFSKRKLQDSLDYQLLSEGRTPQYLGIHFSVLVPYKRKGRT